MLSQSTSANTSGSSFTSNKVEIKPKIEIPKINPQGFVPFSEN